MVLTKQDILPILITAAIAGLSELASRGFPIDWKTTGISALIAAIMCILINLKAKDDAAKSLKLSTMEKPKARKILIGK